MEGVEKWAEEMVERRCGIIDSTSARAQVSDAADAVIYMAGLPLSANVLHMTVTLA